MKRVLKVLLAGMFAAGSIAVCAVAYGKFSDSVTVTNHISTGDINISLKELEKKGLIQRIQSAENKKHVEIVLLDNADQIVKAGIKAQKKFAKIFLKDLTQEEKNLCINVFTKICNNAEEYLKNYMERD